VVKLILQPLVENSIGHGLKEDEQGRISIRAYSDGDFHQIRDQGQRLWHDPRKGRRALKSSFKDDTVYQGVGLKNVYQRIRIYYGERADVLDSFAKKMSARPITDRDSEERSDWKHEE
jgi:two-component system sensor histidine kinase YesM